MTEPFIAIISGTPGAGKTTACAELARRATRGVHVAGDDFLGYIAHPILPIAPESHGQNATVITATAGAVRAYAQAGYTVFVDGIFGPWFMPLLLGGLGDRVPVHYFILSLPLTVAIQRGGARSVDPVAANVVEKMHREFTQAERFHGHRLEVGGLPPARVVEAILERLADGGYRVATTAPADPGPTSHPIPGQG